MNNFNQINQKLETILKKDLRFVDQDGDLLKSEVIDKAWKVDAKLIEMLLSDKEVKTKFFSEIKGHWIFNVAFFVDYVQDKNFLNDSYTKFKNKIGLTIDGKYLNQRNEVALVWPYKDCVLEGGMSDEETKRDEIFFNEILAQDEIDRLLDPKVLTNFKRYTEKGEQPVKEINKDENGNIKDNLVIKGNNLLAMHCLKKQFAGRVKLIYIDPPYNIGNDGFKYNDRFNHSTWLTFMKNRLEVARDLLRDDGVIFVSLDDTEVHYCKILMDEIFGRENFISTIIWNSKYTVSNDARYVSYQHENILFFAKKKESFRIGLFERTDIQNKDYKNRDNDPKGVWKATPIHAKSGKKENNYTITFPNGVKWTPPLGRYPRYSKERLLEIYNEGGLYFNKNGGIDKKTYLSEVKQGVTVGSVWGYKEVGHTHANNEELADLLGKGVFDNPKGSTLIKKIIKVANVKENDIILDYHAGSGTTAHAVLELNKKDGGNRQFILVEQMDYIESVTVPRVQKVMQQQGGGEFVYFELKTYNQDFIDRIQLAKNTKDLEKIWENMKEKSFLNWNVDFRNADLAFEEWKKLDLKKQKHALIQLLSKNQLYVNLSEIEDKNLNCTDEEKKLSAEFYNFGS